MIKFIFVKWIYSCYLIMTKLNKTESFLFYKELFESKNCPQSFQFSMKSDLAFFRAYDESNQLKFWNTFVQFNANFYSPSQEIVHLWENFWNWLKIFYNLFLILAHLTFFFLRNFAGDWTWRPLCWTSHRHWPCPWCSRGLAWNLCSHCLRFEM